MADLKISQINGGVTTTPAAGDKIPAVRAGANILLDAGDFSGGAGGGVDDFQPPIVAGNYYSGQGVVPSGSANWMANTLVAVPVWFSFTETWTRIGIHVRGDEPGASVRLGIWENGPDNQPGSLLLDSGNLSLDSIGDAVATIAQTLSANTVYWLGIVSNTGGTAVLVSSYFTGEVAARLGHAAGFVDGVSGGVLKNMAFGALPDPFGTPDAYADSSPLVWLRKV